MRISPLHSPRAPEFPVLRSFAKFGPDGIPFDVAQNRIKRIVFFDGKRLRSTLVKMPGPFRMVVSMPTHGMGVCQPSKEVRERIVIRWANHKMPVVEHQTVAQKWQRKLGVSFDEYPFKRLVVLKFFQQWQPCHGSIEHMETSSARTSTGATRHAGRIKSFSRDVNLMSCVPFSFRFSFRNRCCLLLADLEIHHSSWDLDAALMLTLEAFSLVVDKAMMLQS